MLGVLLLLGNTDFVFAENVIHKIVIQINTDDLSTQKMVH